MPALGWALGCPREARGPGPCLWKSLQGRGSGGTEEGQAASPGVWGLGGPVPADYSHRVVMY